MLLRPNVPWQDLSRSERRRTSAGVAKDLFDMHLRALRRDRAFRNGPELFLLDRAFADLLDRLSFVQRPFRSALLLGCPDPAWADRLRDIAGSITVVDPGALFAHAAAGHFAQEDRLNLPDASFSLCVAVGTLDTINDLPGALRSIREVLAPDALLIGTISGGETLPRLRAAMRAADLVQGAAAPHVHPRVDAPSLAMLLASAGFREPVVDIDRVDVSYRSLSRLVADLRGMAGTNLLTDRSRRPLSRLAWKAAEAEFLSNSNDGRTIETFELLNFAAWTAAAPGGTA
jgi:SAM-dependent methyltransferase